MMVTQGNTAPDFTLETDKGAKVFEKVTPQGHAAEVLAAL